MSDELEDECNKEYIGCVNTITLVLAGAFFGYVILKILLTLHTIAAELVKLNETVGGLLKP